MGFATKITLPRVQKSHISYRSFRKFNEEDFRQNVACAPYHVSEIFDDIDDKFGFYETLI